MIAIASDIHALNQSVYQCKYTSLDIALKALTETEIICQRLGIPSVILSGDIFDTRFPSQTTFLKLINFFNESALRWTVIEGNHDLDDLSLKFGGQRPINNPIDILLSSCPNVILGSNLKITYHGGLVFHHIPYYRDEREFFKALDAVGGDVDYLVMHQDISTMFPTSTIDPADPRFKRFKGVFNGHIHQQHNPGPNWYQVGNIAIMNKSDYNGGGEKGITVVTNETVEFKPLTGTYPTFIWLDSDTEITDEHRENFIIQSRAPMVVEGKKVQFEPVEVDKLEVVQEFVHEKEIKAGEGYFEDLFQRVDFTERENINSLNFLSIKGRGFLSYYDDYEIDLTNPHTTYKGPSGSGKSSIPRMVSWAIRGKFNPLVGRSVVDPTSVFEGMKSRGVYVELEFLKSGYKYYLVRAKKMKPLDSGLKYVDGVHILDEDRNELDLNEMYPQLSETMKGSPISRIHTAKVMRFLGLTDDLIDYSINFSPQSSNLAILPRAELRKVLEAIRPTQWADELVAAVLQDAAKAKLERDEGDRKLEDVVRRKGLAEQAIAIHEKSLKEQSDAQKEELSRLRRAIEEQEAVLDAVEEEVAQGALDTYADKRYSYLEKKEKTAKCMQKILEVGKKIEMLEAVGEKEKELAGLQEDEKASLKLLEQLSEEKTELKADVEQARVYKKERLKLEGELSGSIAEIADIDARLSRLEEQVLQVQEKIEDLEMTDFEGASCPSCGQPLTEDHKAKAIADNEDAIKKKQDESVVLGEQQQACLAERAEKTAQKEKIESEIVKLDKALAEIDPEGKGALYRVKTEQYAKELTTRATLTGSIVKIQEDLKELGDAPEQLKAAKAKNKKYRNKLTNLEISSEELHDWLVKNEDAYRKAQADIQQVKAAKATIKNLRVTLASEESRVLPAALKLSMARGELESYVQEEVEIRGELDILSAKADGLTALHKALSYADAFKSFVISQHLGELKFRVNEYAKAMNMGFDIRAEGQEYKMSAKFGKQFREVSALSLGQTIRVGLALLAATQDMRDTYKVRVKNVFLDEPFGAVDPQTESQIFTMLSEIDDRQLNVITHSPRSLVQHGRVYNVTGGINTPSRISHE